MTFNANFYDVE